MNETADLAKLEVRHTELENEIDAELHRPLPDQAHITELKREKLKVKEEMAMLSGDLVVA